MQLFKADYRLFQLSQLMIDLPMESFKIFIRKVYKKTVYKDPCVKEHKREIKLNSEQSL